MSLNGWNDTPTPPTFILKNKMIKKLSLKNIRERDKRRYNYLLKEKERMGSYFLNNEEIYFLRDKHNFNSRSIKLNSESSKLKWQQKNKQK